MSSSTYDGDTIYPTLSRLSMLFGGGFFLRKNRKLQCFATESAKLGCDWASSTVVTWESMLRGPPAGYAVFLWAFAGRVKAAAAATAANVVFLKLLFYKDALRSR